MVGKDNSPAARSWKDLKAELRRQNEAIVRTDRKRFLREANVLVWTQGIGHAAIKLRHGHQVDYISWWPADETPKDFQTAIRKGGAQSYMQDRLGEISDRAHNKLISGQSTPRTGQRLFYLHDSEKKYFTYGQQPHQKVYLVGAGTDKRRDAPVDRELIFSRVWGLCVPRMFAWWRGFQKGGEHYQLESKTNNCAAIVCRALHQGGAGAFAAAVLSPDWTRPVDVLNWARAIGQKLDQLHQSTKPLVKRAEQVAQANGARFLFEAPGLPPPSLWVKGTSRPTGSRSPAVQSVDTHLVTLDGLRGQTGSGVLVPRMRACVLAFESAILGAASAVDSQDQEALEALAMITAIVFMRYVDLPHR